FGASLGQEVAAVFVELVPPCREVEAFSYRLEQHASPEPTDANLVTGKAEFLRQPDRLAAAVLEDLGGAGFGHLQALMIDTNGIYHLEVAAAMFARLLRGPSPGRGLTARRLTALSQG